MPQDAPTVRSKVQPARHQRVSLDTMLRERSAEQNVQCQVRGRMTHRELISGVGIVRKEKFEAHDRDEQVLIGQAVGALQRTVLLGIVTTMWHHAWIEMLIVFIYTPPIIMYF